MQTVRSALFALVFYPATLGFVLAGIAASALGTTAHVRAVVHGWADFHHRRVREAQRVDRLDHRLVFDRDEVRAGRNGAVPFEANPHDVANEPVVHPRPAVHHRLDRAGANRTDRDHGDAVDQRSRVEQEIEQERAKYGHQMSSQTATRRRRYLLYSPNRVTNLGSLRTASGTTVTLSPSWRRNS